MGTGLRVAQPPHIPISFLSAQFQKSRSSFHLGYVPLLLKNVCSFLWLTVLLFITTDINEVVDEVFPSLLSQWEQHAREEFSDFNHWHLSAATINIGYDDPELRDISRLPESTVADRESDEFYVPGHLAKSVLGD